MTETQHRHCWHPNKPFDVDPHPVRVYHCCRCKDVLLFDKNDPREIGEKTHGGILYRTQPYVYFAPPR